MKDNNWRARLCIVASSFKEWYESQPDHIKMMYDAGFTCAGCDLRISGELNVIQKKMRERGFTGLTGLDPFRR